MKPAQTPHIPDILIADDQPEVLEALRLLPKKEGFRTSLLGAAPKVLTHTGDKTMNFANVWIAPKRDFGILLCVNQSGQTAAKAADDATVALLQLFSEKTSAE